MDLKNFLKSQNFKIIASVIGIVIIVLLSFDLGVRVGFHKARYSYNFGENYERNFGGGPPPPGPMGFFRDFQDNGFRNAHGISGKIVSIDNNNLIITDRDNKENTVTVTDNTVIDRGGSNIKISDLEQNDQVIIVGNPGDNGVINADIIRVFNNDR